MAWGGEPVSHSISQEKMWSKLKEFWSTHIGEPMYLRPVEEIDQEKSKL